MNDQPTVSILIPCRNAEQYLASTLESVVAQSLASCETIVVDDGSTDRSVEIAGHFAPRVLVHANPGRGVSAARNHATRLARGAYLQYLDADDLLEPHALASRVDALQVTGAEVAISDWQRLVVRDGQWRAAAIESGMLPADALPADLLIFRGFWAPPAAILYRRTICDRIGGWRESLPIVQDARYLLDAARVGGRLVHVSGVGARYRQHAANSVSTRGPAAFWWDVLRNTREVEVLWESAGRLDAVHRSALASAYAHCAREGFTHRRDLFEAAVSDLHRFPGRPESRLLRASLLFTRLGGYQWARRLLAPLTR